MQLVLPLMDIEDPAPMAAVWEALEPDEQTAVVAILARVMTKAMAPKETSNE